MYMWCITGAGHLLEEIVDVMSKISRKNRISSVFSNAGYEVAGMYGLLEKIESISSEIILEKDQGKSCPITGRFSRGKYGKVIVAPCTANSTAKIYHGVADSLVTNIVSQAIKNKIPVVILPTDMKKKVKSRMAISVDDCKNCKICLAIEKCPTRALYRKGNRVKINLLKCTGCKICIKNCKFNAISFGKEVMVYCREIDIKNVKKLKKMEGIRIIENPDEIG